MLSALTKLATEARSPVTSVIGIASRLSDDNAWRNSAMLADPLLRSPRFDWTAGTRCPDEGWRTEKRSCRGAHCSRVLQGK